MANRKEYLERLKLTVEQLHNCSARYCTTEAVTETFQGRTIWEGHVEIFDLVGHPKAKRCYGWSHRAGEDDSGERFVTVLELPPVKSAYTAVQVAIASEVKEKAKGR